MSIEARTKLVNSTNTYFQDDSQRADFLDLNKTRTETIALVLELIEKGHILEFTAVRSDHGDDSCLGHYSHAAGAAFDFWPLVRHEAGAYADLNSPQMLSLIRDLMASKWTEQVGLGGTADCTALINAAGYLDYPDDGRLFRDNGEDHIHAGCVFPKGN